MWFFNLLHHILPNCCKTCGTALYSRSVICHDCFDKVDRITPPICSKCGKPAHVMEDPSEERYQKESFFTCSECYHEKKYFTKAVSAIHYNEKINKIIHLFKYKGHPSIAKDLARMLAEAVRCLPEIDVITYVPLHVNRLRSREFNQSYLLALHLSKTTGSKIVHGMERVRDSNPQVGLSRKERRQNIRNIFRVKNRDLFHEKNVLLVDDIYTTGNTINECARALRKAGPKAVFAATVAMKTR